MHQTRVAELLTKLAAPSTVPTPAPTVAIDADYVEKLASAVEFVLSDGEPKQEPTPTEKTASAPVDLSAVLREKLRARTQEKTASKVAADEQRLVGTVLGRLQELRQAKLAHSEAATTEGQTGEGATAKVADAAPVTPTEEEPAGVAGDEKPPLNLADLLQRVVEGDGSPAEGSTSTPAEGAKTASVAGGSGAPKSRKEAVDLMRSRIMAGHQGR